MITEIWGFQRTLINILSAVFKTIQPGTRVTHRVYRQPGIYEGHSLVGRGGTHQQNPEGDHQCQPYFIGNNCQCAGHHLALTQDMGKQNLSQVDNNSRRWVLEAF